MPEDRSAADIAAAQAAELARKRPDDEKAASPLEPADDDFDEDDEEEWELGDLEDEDDEDTDEEDEEEDDADNPDFGAHLEEGVEIPLETVRPPVEAPAPEAMRCMYVGVFGAPNAGKSALVNRIVGSKITIVSPKEQTTRRRVRGVNSEGDVQLVFVDTPGLFAPNPKRKLEQYIVGEALEEMQDPDGADLRLLVIDAMRGMCERTEAAIKLLRGRASVALNKTDLVEPKTKLLLLVTRLLERYPFEDIFMISARTGDGVDSMMKSLRAKAQLAPWMFEPQDLTDASLFFALAETTRECLYYALQQELPYGAAVMTDSAEKNKRGEWVVHQTIYLAKESHKPMLIGAGGASLKAIGENSRHRMFAITGKKTHLFLHVKVKEDWIRRPEQFGNM